MAEQDRTTTQAYLFIRQYDGGYYASLQSVRGQSLGETAHQSATPTEAEARGRWWARQYRYTVVWVA